MAKAFSITPSMKPIDLDMLTKDEIQRIASHFVQTQADVFIGVWNDIEMFVFRQKFAAWNLKRFEKREDMTGKRIGTPQQVAPPTNAPFCKEHPKLRMRYNPGNGTFVCPDKECDVVARPKVKQEDFENVVLAGDVELVKTTDDKFYLHITDRNVMLDVNNVIEMTGTGRLHGSQDEWTLMLRFPGIREVDGVIT